MAGYNSLPYFSGVRRQRGRGLGAFAGTVARSAFPILKKYFVPAAKRIGKDLIEAAIPQIDEVMSGRSNIKKAAKRTATATLKKQLGAGPPRKKSKLKKSKAPRKKKKKITSKKSRKQTSRQDYLKHLP